MLFGQDQNGFHPQQMRHFQIFGQILEHDGRLRLDLVPVEKPLIGHLLRLWDEFGIDNIEHRLEMLLEAQLLCDIAGMAARTVGKDQLAARQSGNRQTQSRIGGERVEIDVMGKIEIGMRINAVLGHQAVQRGAVAVIIMLLQGAGRQPVQAEKV